VINFLFFDLKTKGYSGDKGGFFYVFTTWVFDRNRRLADDGVCQRRAGIYSSERRASVGCPATHGAYAAWDWPDGLDEPQLFLDDQPEVVHASDMLALSIL
jgi:hypothetical protein